MRCVQRRACPRPLHLNLFPTSTPPLINYESSLGVDESGLFAVEQLVLAKYHMTQQVYAHRIRIITDYMIVRGLELAIEGGLEEICNLYEYDESPEFCRRYTNYYDDRVSDIVLNCGSEAPRSIFERLHSRRLFKQLIRLPLTAKHVTDAVLLSRYLQMSSDSRKLLEQRVSQYLKCEPWEVIIDVKNVKNPAYQAIGVLNPEEILIQDHSGLRRDMNSYDEVVTGKLPSYDTLYVIGPYTQHSQSKSSLVIEKELIKILDEHVGEL